MFVRSFLFLFAVAFFYSNSLLGNNKEHGTTEIVANSDSSSILFYHSEAKPKIQSLIHCARNIFGEGTVQKYSAILELCQKELNDLKFKSSFSVPTVGERNILDSADDDMAEDRAQTGPEPVFYDEEVFAILKQEFEDISFDLFPFHEKGKNCKDSRHMQPGLTWSYKHCKNQFEIFTNAYKDAKKSGKFLIVAYGYTNCSWCVALQQLISGKPYQIEINERLLKKYGPRNSGQAFTLPTGAFAEPKFKGLSAAEGGKILPITITASRLNPTGALLEGKLSDLSINGSPSPFTPQLYVINPENGKVARIENLSKYEDNDPKGVRKKDLKRFSYQGEKLFEQIKQLMGSICVR